MSEGAKCETRRGCTPRLPSAVGSRCALATAADVYSPRRLGATEGLTGARGSPWRAGCMAGVTVGWPLNAERVNGCAYVTSRVTYVYVSIQNTSRSDGIVCIRAPVQLRKPFTLR